METRTNSEIITDAIKEVTSTTNDPALLAELMVMLGNSSN